MVARGGGGGNRQALWTAFIWSIERRLTKYPRQQVVIELEASGVDRCWPLPSSMGTRKLGFNCLNTTCWFGGIFFTAYRSPVAGEGKTPFTTVQGIRFLVQSAGPQGEGEGDGLGKWPLLGDGGVRKKEKLFWYYICMCSMVMKGCENRERRKKWENRLRRWERRKREE
jgi:hypothetical protein